MPFPLPPSSGVIAAQATSVLSPASPQGKTVLDLFVLTGVIMTVVLVIVCGWIGYILMHYRARPDEADAPDPPPVFGNRRLELVWTAIPFLIVVILTILMVRDIGRSRPAVAAGRTPDVVVIGHQWWWEVQYPSTGLTTANEVHVPTGRPFLVQLRSADVVHDFWVPQLGPKEDMIPTLVNHLWLEPEAPGVYDGACAEFCGNDHAWMRIRVIAQTPDDFEAWMAGQLRPASAAATALAQRGRAVFEQSTCRNCHALAGVPAAQASYAPDLTNLADRTTLGAGVMANSRDTLAAWLRDPQQYKPGSNMPNFHLSDDDVRALTAYLWQSASTTR